MENTSPLEHNFGPKCRMAPVSPPVVSDDDHDEMPPLHAQFFYSSLIPIDDPLSSGAITGVPDAKASKGNLRPFSPGDNNALQKAWFNLISDGDRQAHRQALAKPSSLEPPHTSKAVTSKLALVVRHLALKHKNKHEKLHPQDIAAPGLEDQPITPMATCCAELYMDVANELHLSFCSLVRERNPTLSVESVLQEVVTELRRLRLASEKKPTTEAPPPKVSSPGFPFDLPFSPRRTASGTSTPRLYEPEDRDIAKGRSSGIEIKNSRVRSGSAAAPFSTIQASSSVPVRMPPVDDGISGKPFVRVGSLEPTSSPRQAASPVLSPAPERPVDDKKPEKNIEDEEASDTVVRFDDIIADTRAGSEYGKDATIDVAVGLSRLHMVSLPILQMKPIYWSPVNDLAIVSRATWFYRDTMLPIPAAVANQLEAGYKELRPYSQAWNDELKCAVDIGPAGEEKVSHRLWPKDPERVDSVSAAHAISHDQYCAARCFRGEAAAEGSAALPQPNQDDNEPMAASAPPFAQYHVIYKNAAEAFLLKPSLKPSAYYGRRPVYRIMKGLTVGIPVCRGFDRKMWDRLYDKKTSKAADAERPATEFSQLATEHAAQGFCPACKANNNKGQVTDLVLVAHGIGQKFAERVESFHFTHAINAFRRAVNLELRKPAVKHVLRDGQNGIMVLPINWRHALSFEDGGPMREEDKTSHRAEGFGLKDIEPPTIKAVRSLISDIMFDIPFYMSHHKGKMIQALVAEANRVYRLWCRNNPGFRQNGRVHMIAHSLGSAMALEILSKQPNIPPPMNLNIDVSDTKHFEFDTKNLFFVGSPAGFFLLLERGALIPRRGRHKPGVDDGDADAKNVVADAGTFGCLAVDNIYNVLAKEDPIAYFLNGTIDPAYAASLKTAYVPSTAVSLLKSMGDAVRGIIPGAAAPAIPGTAEHEAEALLNKPPPMRLPSQLELEVHDFSREEVAEKKAFLLNDNGQIDYFLRSGGGPLEIQYLNMLGAHSSYWTSNDFIRMLCTEVGRAPGRENTLPAMRAVKAAKRIMPNTH
jgi:hypothetical protein